jgi:predicted enzyme related to lactoylglutathione lyase
MTSSVTHFEIYGEEPAKLADFYPSIFGWQVGPQEMHSDSQFQTSAHGMIRELAAKRDQN